MRRPSFYRTFPCRSVPREIELERNRVAVVMNSGGANRLRAGEDRHAIEPHTRLAVPPFSIWLSSGLYGRG